MEHIIIVVKSQQINTPPWGQMRSMSLNMSPDMWHGRGNMLSRDMFGFIILTVTCVDYFHADMYGVTCFHVPCEVVS